MVMRTGAEGVHNLLPRQGIRPYTFHLVMFVDFLWASLLWDVLLVSQHSSNSPMPLSRRQRLAECLSIYLLYNQNLNKRHANELLAVPEARWRAVCSCRRIEQLLLHSLEHTYAQYRLCRESTV